MTDDKELKELFEKLTKVKEDDNPIPGRAAATAILGCLANNNAQLSYVLSGLSGDALANLKQAASDWVQAGDNFQFSMSGLVLTEEQEQARTKAMQASAQRVLDWFEQQPPHNAI